LLTSASIRGREIHTTLYVLGPAFDGWACGVPGRFPTVLEPGFHPGLKDGLRDRARTEPSGSTALLLLLGQPQRLGCLRQAIGLPVSQRQALVLLGAIEGPWWAWSFSVLFGLVGLSLGRGHEFEDTRRRGLETLHSLEQGQRFAGDTSVGRRANHDRLKGFELADVVRLYLTRLERKFSRGIDNNATPCETTRQPIFLALLEQAQRP